MKKAYHGTTLKNAKQIIKSGFFEKGTWFAFDPHDAAHYGGPILFERDFDESLLSKDVSWQFHIAERMPLGIKEEQWGAGSLNRKTNKKATWIIQQNISSTPGTTTLDALCRACEAAEQPYHSVKVIPFSNNLPKNMPKVDGPFVVYGYTTMMMNALKSKTYRQGMFFDPSKFKTSEYLKNWGEHMLNVDAKICTIKQLEEIWTDSNKIYFVKPDDDFKAFTGSVIDWHEWRSWVVNCLTASNKESLHADTKIVYCEPKTINAEYRLVMVDGKVVASSQYVPNASSFVPPEIHEFAQDRAKEWSPAPVFVLDIARTTEYGRHRFRIIEANCFNGSGFYECDLAKVVMSVSSYVESVV